MADAIVATTPVWYWVWEVGFWVLGPVLLVLMLALSRHPDGLNLIRGGTRKERRRLSELARSGEAIQSPGDAELVRLIVEGTLERESLRAARAISWVLPLWGAVFWLVPAIVNASRGAWVRAAFGFAFFLLFALAFIPRRRTLQQYERTASANGWTLPSVHTVP